MREYLLSLFFILVSGLGLFSCSSWDEGFIYVEVSPPDSSVYVNSQLITSREGEGRVKVRVNVACPLSLIVLNRGYHTEQREALPESTFWRSVFWGSTHLRGGAVKQRVYEIELKPFASKEERRQNPTLKEALAQASHTRKEWRQKKKRDDEGRELLLKAVGSMTMPSRQSSYVRGWRASYPLRSISGALKSGISRAEKDYVYPMREPREAKRERIPVSGFSKKAQNLPSFGREEKLEDYE